MSPPPQSSTSPDESQVVSSPGPDERYAQNVVNYSKLDARADGVCGLHYNRLGKFLISPYKSYDQEWSTSIDDIGFAPVTLCDLTKSHDSSARVTSFYRPDDFTQHLRQQTLQFIRESSDNEPSKHHRSPMASPKRSRASSVPSTSSSHSQSKHSGRMVFLHGFPSPQWLNHLGAALDADPEFFYRHMYGSIGFASHPQRLDHFLSTPFPCTPDLLQIRICNIGSWDLNKSGSGLRDLREDCEAHMKRHLDDFTRMRSLTIGDSVVRRFNPHDMHDFSLEQTISIEIIHHTQPWTILVWVDSGRDLIYSTSGPWLRSAGLAKSVTMHPIFQHRPRMALTPIVNLPLPDTSANGHNLQQPLPQSANYLQKYYGRHLKPEIMQHDIFYALNELFEFSAASVDQLLEFSEHKALIMLQPLTLEGANLAEVLILKASVDEYRAYVSETLDYVRKRGNPKWPRATADTKLRASADRAADQLEVRYLRLLQRSNRLSERLESGISMLTSQESHRQAQQAITQADRLGKLSLLAYIYIPITFAASFFGMNFLELGEHLSIWAFFLLASALLAASLVAWFLDVRAIYGFTRRYMRGLLYLQGRSQG